MHRKPPEDIRELGGCRAEFFRDEAPLGNRQSNGKETPRSARSILKQLREPLRG
jgi:hypothetical protein